MSTCKLCGKDLSEAGDAALCENCQSLRNSITEEQAAKTKTTKKNRREFLYLILIILFFIFIVNFFTNVGKAKTEAAAERAVQELTLSETGQTPYAESTIAYTCPVSTFVIVSYSAIKEEMRQGVYLYRLVTVLGNYEIDSISDPNSPQESETP